VPITTKDASLNPTHGEMYLIQHYVIKCVSDLQKAGQWFSLGSPVSSTNKTDCHDIAEILLKVALNTKTLTLKNILVISNYHRNHNTQQVFTFNRSKIQEIIYKISQLIYNKTNK
jgi:hypothetical protein